MSEERLRDLLERAVPEAPEIRANEVPARAAAVRRRRVAAGGAALAVAAAVVGGIALRSAGDNEVGVADDVPTTPTGSTAPYDVPVCPMELPGAPDANTSLPDRDDVIAIRLCPDLSVEHYRRDIRETFPDETGRLADLDALVGDVGGFWDAVTTLPPFDPTVCATINYFDNNEALMFVALDGSTTLVRTGFCSTINTGSGRVDGGRIAEAFLTALDRQRDELAYTRPYQGTLGCRSLISGGPGKPGREELVSATYCPGQDKPGVPLDDDQLIALRAAWAEPAPVSEQLNEAGENDCTEGGDGAWLVAGTDRSDRVAMHTSPCGYLVWDSWRPGENAAIPITLEELGLR